MLPLALLILYFAVREPLNPFGLARMSLTTLVRMLVAAVWEVALRFVCTPTGTKPETAIKQKAAIPKARVTSTRENAAWELMERFTVDRSWYFHRTPLTERRNSYCHPVAEPPSRV